MLLFTACKEKSHPLFTVMDSRETGVDFVNNLNLTDTFNILDYLYYYNGGGVAVGDLDGDGLPDIYFSSNRGANKLYRNKGSLQFEEVTDSAGVAGIGNWKTGVTLADVNADGLLDIYLCAVGGYKSLHGRNQLFINQGNMRFSEEAAAYGLDAEGFNTQASFFDYDKDGDLDMFLVNHSVHSVESYGDTSLRSKKAEASGDKLFRNNGAGSVPRFSEVTVSAGIYSSSLGYGLSVLTVDFTGDGWEDIYVSNDFHEQDYYYINQRNGSFKESGRTAFGHQSRFSMGTDAADIDGDGMPDLITLDMLPEEEKVLKSSAGDDPLDIYEFKFSRGYHHQFARNCLQLNGGNGTSFRDIALFAGVAATDWSWSPLLADFNNDGIRDLFVSNGIPKRPNDLDFIKYVSSGSVSAALQQGKGADAKAVEAMPSGAAANYFWEGGSQLRFVNRSAEWGAGSASISNGATYADLDGDGDLDIVTNNLNSPAFIYRNNSNEQTKNSFLHINVTGAGLNTQAVGTKVTIWQQGKLQAATVSATRGFQSAGATGLHFGLGKNSIVDSLIVVWPDGNKQVINYPKIDQTLTLKQPAVPVVKNENPAQQLGSLFSEQPALIPFWKHAENLFYDFNSQQLIPHSLATQGPKIAVGDINRDGLDDFFVCGGPGQPGMMAIQTAAGKWVQLPQPALARDAACEDVDATFFDADGDGDQDLYVVGGGNEWSDGDTLLNDRLYENDGEGMFTKKAACVTFGGNRSVVCAADFDGDGDPDLFVGGRTVWGSYGNIPVSHLLINDGKGNFTPATEAIAPGLQKAGMVSCAVWTDLDRDGWPELVLAGEWMPITVFKNEKGRLRNATEEMGLQQTTGLWTALVASDLNNDGWPELLAGNRGTNSKLRASPAHPLLLYTGDLDGNGSTDQILALHKEGAYFPFLGKEELERALPSVIRKQFAGYTDMAGQTLEQIFGNRLRGMQQLGAQNLSSLVMKNNKGKFQVAPLPNPMQWSPVFAFALCDVDGDGREDVISGGNFFGVLPFEGRYDAGGVQVWLRGKNPRMVLPAQSGLPQTTEVRDIKLLRTVRGKKVLLVAANNAPIQVFALP